MGRGQRKDPADKLDTGRFKVCHSVHENLSIPVYACFYICVYVQFRMGLIHSSVKYESVSMYLCVCVCWTYSQSRGNSTVGK